MGQSFDINEQLGHSLWSLEDLEKVSSGNNPGSNRMLQ